MYLTVENYVCAANIEELKTMFDIGVLNTIANHGMLYKVAIR